MTGPFLPDLLLSILSSWFLYFSIKNKIYFLYKNPFFLIFIIFWLVCILSSLLSENIFLSLKSSLFFIRIGIFAILISYLINQSTKILNYFYLAFIITFLFLIIDGYFQYYFGTNLLGYKKIGIRVSSFFGDELILGSYLVRLLPLFVGLFIIKQNKKNWEYYIFSLFVILVSILVFLSGERVSLFFLLLYWFFIIFFIRNFKLIFVVIFFIFFSLFILLNYSNPAFKMRFINETLEKIDFKSENKFFFTPEHNSLFYSGWNMFLDKPILGHGPKLFRIKCSVYNTTEEKYCDSHPHNFYIQLLAEVGIVGFSFLLGLFFYFIYLCVRHIFEYFKSKYFFLNDFQICLLGGLLITIWPFSPNGNIFNNYLMMFYGLQMGFLSKKIKPTYQIVKN